MVAVRAVVVRAVVVRVVAVRAVVVRVVGVRVVVVRVVVVRVVVDMAARLDRVKSCRTSYRINYSLQTLSASNWPHCKLRSTRSWLRS